MAASGRTESFAGAPLNNTSNSPSGIGNVGYNLYSCCAPIILDADLLCVARKAAMATEPRCAHLTVIEIDAKMCSQSTPICSACGRVINSAKRRGTSNPLGYWPAGFFLPVPYLMLQLLQC